MKLKTHHIYFVLLFLLILTILTTHYRVKVGYFNDTWAIVTNDITKYLLFGVVSSVIIGGMLKRRKVR